MDKPIKCFTGGCKNPATVLVQRLWGDKGTFHNCDRCKPNINNRPEWMRNEPFWYKVTPLNEILP